MERRREGVEGVSRDGGLRQLAVPKGLVESLGTVGTWAWGDKTQGSMRVRMSIRMASMRAYI